MDLSVEVYMQHVLSYDRETFRLYIYTLTRQEQRGKLQKCQKRVNQVDSRRRESRVRKHWREKLNET